jgi:hypothetical protein
VSRHAEEQLAPCIAEREAFETGDHGGGVMHDARSNSPISIPILGPAALWASRQPYESARLSPGHRFRIESQPMTAQIPDRIEYAGALYDITDAHGARSVRVHSKRLVIAQRWPRRLESE